ncbi:potassium channel family protein [Catenovulum sediminis]|uniref:potassium channel family protein n=1 Tax=Catenovulum sediminis TaxID=1740262 RepID=UPI00117CDD63|nr:potassium channel family protein [Catenovulum sediminis]
MPSRIKNFKLFKQALNLCKKPEFYFVVLLAISILLPFIELFQASIVFGFLSSIPALLFIYKRHGKLSGLISSFLVPLIYLPYILGLYSWFYTHTGLLYNQVQVHDFFSALYFSVVTWTTLGYGDFQPSEHIRLWAAGQAIFGYLFMSIYVAILFAAITKFSEEKTNNKAKLRGLMLMLKYTNKVYGFFITSIDPKISSPEINRITSPKIELLKKELQEFVLVHSMRLDLSFIEDFENLLLVLERLNKKSLVFCHLGHNSNGSYIVQPLAQQPVQINNGITDIAIDDPYTEVNETLDIIHRFEVRYPFAFKSGDLKKLYTPNLNKDNWYKYCNIVGIHEQEKYSGTAKNTVFVLDPIAFKKGFESDDILASMAKHKTKLKTFFEDRS